MNAIVALPVVGVLPVATPANSVSLSRDLQVHRKAVTARAEQIVDDPIYAPIEKHKKAYAAFGDCLAERSRLEDLLPKAARQSAITAWENTIVETDDPRWIAAEQQVWELGEDEQIAALELLDVRPTSVNGVLALLRYAVAFEESGGEWPRGLVDDGAPETARGKDWLVFLARSVEGAIANICGDRFAA
jgi:hypothetical protein